MKWKIKSTRIPVMGEQRIVQRFLFFPTLLEKDGGIQEVRWLCFSKIVQTFKGRPNAFSSRWKNLCWNN